MQYPHIIALIDSYLERLCQVRQLLTETETLPKKAEEKASSAPTPDTVDPETQVSPSMELPQLPARKKANTGKSPGTLRPAVERVDALASPLLTTEPVPAIEEPLGLEQAPAEAKRLRPEAILPFSSRARRQTHRRTSTSGASSDAAPAKALVGIVPLTPVFISAEKLRQEQASKHQQQDLPTVHLTAESLAQRWTHSIH